MEPGLWPLGILILQRLKILPRKSREPFPDLKVLPLEIDVAREGSVDDAIAQAASKFGRIDYAVNNAGIGGDLLPSAELGSPQWQKVVDINLTGVWKSSRAEIRQMLKQEPLEAK